MSSSEVKKRLFFLLLILAILGGSAYLWLSEEIGGAVQKRTIGDTTLYVPKQFLAPKPEGLTDMVNVYIATFADKQRFQTRAIELLPDLAGSPASLRHSQIIWTLESKKADGDVNPVTSHQMPELDMAFIKGDAPFENRRLVPVENSLNRLYRGEKDEATFGVTNLDTGKYQSDETLWVAHCVHFRALREGSSWGRCSRTLILDDMRLTFHFDGLLISQTKELSISVQKMVDFWRTNPN